MTSSIKNENFPILFVDDDPIAHKLMEVYLRNWKVYYAYSGEDALDILDKENVQVVITDINMPNMNGIDLLKKIKKKHGTVQVIILTGENQIEYLISALSQGANDFLLKPVSKEKIEEALEYTLQKIKRWKTVMKQIFIKKTEDTQPE